MFFVFSICALNAHVAVCFHARMHARVSKCSNNSCTGRGSRLALRCSVFSGSDDGGLKAGRQQVRVCSRVDFGLEQGT